jgi:hypothetical protein
MPSLIDDVGYQDSLLSLILNDRAFLRRHSTLLTAGDFKPASNSGSRDRWIIATKALEHYQKYREPIGKLIGVELRDHVRIARFGKDRAKELAGLARNLLGDVPSSKAVSDRLVEWRVTAERTKAIDEIIELNAANELSNLVFSQIVRRVANVEDSIGAEVPEYFDSLEERITRRAFRKDHRYPAIMIDPVDQMVRSIARGQLGLVMAPYKRGKSLFLIQIAKAYTLQGFNVLYITLEDPKDDVEDRFDAGIAEIPVKEIGDNPAQLRKRFQRFRRLLKSKLKIYDGTDGGITISKVIQIYEAEKELGFQADAIIVDYDEEIEPESNNQQRRMDFDQIYRSFRRFCAREQLLGWTAAQTKRNTSDLKIIVGDEIGEDIGKAKKVACCFALGRGDWGDDSIYVHVAAHKFDRGNIGCNIMPDLPRMLIFDRDATHAMEKADVLKQLEELENDE